MNLRSRKLRVLLSLIVLSTVGSAYRRYHRYREIHDFFRNQNDLAWAKHYLDKKINFCDAPWGETVVLKNGEHEIFTSPSGRFKIKPNGQYYEGTDLLLIDAQTSRRFKAESTYLSHDEFKWTDDERFLIFTTSVTKDDWGPAKIFIIDTGTGQSMFLGDSAFYDCGLRHW